MEVYTIGFTKTTAAEFFGKLKAAGVRQLVDVRWNNKSQLAGFAKRDDLEFFLAEICGIEYRYEPALAPTKEMLDAYKKHKGSWDEYVESFLQLMADRQVDKTLDSDLFCAPTALLCSEHDAEHCHRRLILDYLDSKWRNVRAIHL